MASSVEDADECQKCEEEEATTAVVVAIGGVPAGPLFVCDDCADREDCAERDDL